MSTKNEAKSSEIPAKNASQGEKSSKTEKNERAGRLQLGLFREEANAKALAKRVEAKGFKADIATEVRPSGTKYYLVVVNENANGTMGEELRTAGFECYPLFD